MSEHPIRPIIPALGGFHRKAAGLGYPIIRFFTGLMLMPHGAAKLFGWFGGDIERTAGFFAAKGLEPALPLAYLVGATEFIGGFFLAIGFLVRPTALAVTILMAVAAFHIHLANGFFWSKGGYEYPLLWGLIALALALGGAGRWSVDRCIGREF